jgi:hypothetical protein
VDPARSRSEREVVASFSTQAEAHEAVQCLADAKLDAEHVTVIRDATSMAAKPERASRIPLAMVGMIVGGLLGAVLGIALGISWLLFGGVALGAILGAALPPPSETVRTPIQIEIERHDVVTQPEYALEARRVLDIGGFRVK